MLALIAMTSDRTAPSHILGSAARLMNAGGRMRQKIYPDPYGPDTWDEPNSARVFVHIANSEAWTAITDEPLPPPPISAEAYTAYGLPWFDLWDKEKGHVPRSEILAGVKSIDDLDDVKPPMGIAMLHGAA